MDIKGNLGKTKKVVEIVTNKSCQEISADIVIAMLNKDLLSEGRGADVKIKNVCDAYKDILKAVQS